MLHKNVLKNSFLYIFLSILVIVLLSLFNVFLNNNNYLLTSLNNKDIEISKLVINEVMTSNKGCFTDGEGLYDYIELYNGTSKDINLLNYGLSDKEDGKVKWLFPDVVINKNSYLVVYLYGEEKEGLYANFSLKKEGEELLTLKKPDGKVVDTVRTVKMDSNHSMSRKEDGEWIITDEITPGYSNNVNGREVYLFSRNIEKVDSSLKITELLPSNEGNILIDGILFGYIEVTNDSENDINLKDYYLTDEDKILYKYRFADIVLKPNTSYVIYENDENLFKIRHKKGTIYLTNRDGIVETVSYESLNNGLAYVKFNNTWYHSSNISPGEPNTSKGKTMFMEKLDKAPNDLMISEVMSSNNTYLPQTGNNYSDWIELYNNSESDINLKDYYLSNNRNDTKMYKLPDRVLKAHEYLVVMASGDVSLSNEYIHINFKLSSQEGLILFNKDKIVDSLFIHNIPKGYSYGRNLSYGHYYYPVPTPNYKNDSNGIKEFSNTPVFSKTGGVYNDVDVLELELSGEGDIYYTTDNSTPSNKSTKYTEPIKLTKTTVVKSVIYEADKKNSEIVTNSYIINEHHTLPVMSLSLNASELDKIKRNAFGNDIIDTHVEFYEENSSFSISAGIKLNGSQSRTLKKKSYALKFDSNYDGNLNYKVFDHKNVTSFNGLVLRSGSQEQASAMFRDEFTSGMAVKYMDLDAQDFKPAVLYINASYEGVYFIREKINSSFIENNHNVKGTTNMINYFFFKLEEGNDDVFWNLRRYSNSHDLSTDEAYDYIDSILDIDNFIDYYIMEYTICNYDAHNVRMYNNPNIKNGKIRMLLYDSDYALRSDAGAYFMNYILTPFYYNPKPDTSTLRGLLNNQRFRKRFVERMSYFINNVWNEKNITETYDELYNSIAEEMKRNSDRWGYDYDTFTSSAESIKTNALKKSKAMPKYTKAYFGLSNVEYHEYFG